VAAGLQRPFLGKALGRSSRCVRETALRPKEAAVIHGAYIRAGSILLILAILGTSSLGGQMSN
jgi:hypothetical protein